MGILASFGPPGNRSLGVARAGNILAQVVKVGNRRGIRAVGGTIGRQRGAARGTTPGSVCRNGEVDCDLSLRFDCFVALNMWFEVPLPDSILARGSEDMGTARHLQVLN